MSNEYEHIHTQILAHVDPETQQKLLRDAAGKLSAEQRARLYG